MRDILADLEHWREENKSIALATVIDTWGSSPRGAGAKMALTSDGKVTGSVSGGCVENAVIEAGRETIRQQQPQLYHFGVADETAWDVGLACGGSIEVFIKALDINIFNSLRKLINEETTVVVATVIHGPQKILGREILIDENGGVTGSIGADWDQEVTEAIENILSQAKPRRIQLKDDIEIFADVILPAPKLIMVGGTHIAIALSKLANTLGYQTIVIDPRKIWANKDRFPEVDQLVQAWPDEAFKQVKITRSTAVAMLTHDPKIDDPALRIALSSKAFYVGALGSKATNARRRERLLANGLKESQLSGLHAPIGLDIGSDTPEEIALAIMAEIVATHRKRNQGSATFEADYHPAVQSV